MSVVNEVITKFSFVGSLKPGEDFNSNLKGSIKLLGGFAVGIKAATTFMYAWTSSVTEAIDPMVQLSRETDVSVAALQELGYAASQNGSSLDAVMRSTGELHKRLGEFSRTGAGPAAEAILQLGINIKNSSGEMKQADEIMLDLNKRLGAYNKSERADLLDKLGIDKSMVQLLSQSSEAIDTLRAKARALGTVTKDQADAAASLNDSNTTLRFGISALQNQIAVGLAPVIQKSTEGFIDFLVANKDLMQNGIKKLGDGIIAISGFIDRMTPVALTAAGAFGVWKIATVGLSAAMGVLMSPVVLITGAVAGIALAVDDLIVAFKGGDSVIRGIVLNWTGFDIAPALQNGVAAVKNFVGQAMAEFKLLFGLISGFNFSEVWDRMYQSFINIFQGIYDKLLSLGDFFKFDDFSIDSLNPFSSSADSAIDRVSGGSSSVSNAIVNQSNDIKIYTNDPVAAGRAAVDYSGQSAKDTKQYFDRGGM